MTVVTLRKLDSEVALSPPKKVLAPVAGRYTLRQLEKEQCAVERAHGRAALDRGWTDAPARGREQL